MYRRRAPTPWLAFVLALAGGALLSREHWIAAAIVVVLALVFAAANYFEKDDSSGLYGWCSAHSLWQSRSKRAHATVGRAPA